MYENSHLGPIRLTQVSLVVALPPAHLQSSSTVHDELQPSPLMLLPSSQATNSRLKPLPHFSRQVLVSGSNFRPASISLQSLQVSPVERNRE